MLNFSYIPGLNRLELYESNHVHRHHLDCVGFSVCAAPAYEAQWPFLSLPAKRLNYDGGYDVVNDELPASRQREPMLIPS